MHLVELFELAKFGPEHDRYFADEDLVYFVLFENVFDLLLSFLRLWIFLIEVLHLLLSEDNVSVELS